MGIEFIIKLVRESLIQILMVASPMLGVGLLVGLMISIFQATTSIQEQTLTFVPKIVAIFFSIVIFGNWMLVSLLNFTTKVFDLIPLMTK